MFLLAALIVKNSLFFIYVIFLKQRLRRLPILNLKLSEKSAKLVIKKANFRIFLQISCSNFTLKLYQRLYIYIICQANQVGMRLERVRSMAALFDEPTC